MDECQQDKSMQCNVLTRNSSLYTILIGFLSIGPGRSPCMDPGDPFLLVFCVAVNTWAIHPSKGVLEFRDLGILTNAELEFTIVGGHQLQGTGTTKGSAEADSHVCIRKVSWMESDFLFQSIPEGAQGPLLVCAKRGPWWCFCHCLSGHDCSR